jgi:hypothetical protein
MPMHRIARQELKSEIAELLAKYETNVPNSEIRSSAFAAWRTRLKLLLDRLGPEGAVFRGEIERLFTREHWSSYIDWYRANYASDLRTDPDFWLAEAVRGCRGVLQTLEAAIDNDLLDKLEDRVASEIYGDVLTEAESLLKQKLIPCAAIFARIGLENGLRRLARHYNMPEADTKTASDINRWLRSNDVYPLQTMQAVDSYLAPGNAFAHASTEAASYTAPMIAVTIANIRSFLGNHGL